MQDVEGSKSQQFELCQKQVSTLLYHVVDLIMNYSCSIPSKVTVCFYAIIHSSFKGLDVLLSGWAYICSTGAVLAGCLSCLHR